MVPWQEDGYHRLPQGSTKTTTNADTADVIICVYVMQIPFICVCIWIIFLQVEAGNPVFLVQELPKEPKPKTQANDMITFRFQRQLTISIFFIFLCQVCKWALHCVFPPEREHQGKDHFLPPWRLRHQDKYLGEAQADPEAKKGLCFCERGVQEERCEHGKGHYQAHHWWVGPNYSEAIQVKIA